MTKKKLYYLLGGGISFLLLVLFLFPYIFVRLELVGEEEIEMEYQEDYVELGAVGNLFSVPLTIDIVGSFNEKKLGTQTILYQTRNVFGPIRQIKRKIYVKDATPPVITLLGEREITIFQGETYQEPGFSMIDEMDGDLTSQVLIDNQVDLQKLGTYTITYSGKDKSKNDTKTQRKVNVIAKEITYQDQWDTLSNKLRTWWSGNKKNHVRPVQGAGATEEELKPYNAYYMGPDEKTIYLTFDEGSNDTYTSEIVDILNRYNVKATFFFCQHYVTSNPDLMKKLVASGHSVGNHTKNHKTMNAFATRNQLNTYISEVRDIEKAFLEITGQPMDKVYREPRGEFSIRSLAIVQAMGYKSFFWSADYLDWDKEVSKEEALNKLIERHHNGAIYLLHPKSKGNYLAMEDFIKKMMELGYQFGLVKDISY